MIKNRDFILGIKGIGIFLFYFASLLLKGILTEFLYEANISENLTNLYSLTFSVLVTLIIVYLFKEKLKTDFNDLKENHKNYFSKYLKYWYIALALMALSNLIILQFIPDSLPANEENLRELFLLNPIIIFISAVLVAPILEELVFRGSFRYMFKNNILFVFMSGFVFSAFHVFTSSETLIEFLYIIPYAIPGFAFAIVLTKCKNIFVPIGLHFIHNGVLMSLQFFVLLFG